MSCSVSCTIKIILLWFLLPTFGSCHIILKSLYAANYSIWSNYLECVICILNLICFRIRGNIYALELVISLCSSDYSFQFTPKSFSFLNHCWFKNLWHFLYCVRFVFFSQWGVRCGQNGDDEATHQVLCACSCNPKRIHVFWIAQQHGGNLNTPFTKG